MRARGHASRACVHGYTLFFFLFFLYGRARTSFLSSSSPELLGRPPAVPSFEPGLSEDHRITSYVSPFPVVNPAPLRHAWYRVGKRVTHSSPRENAPGEKIGHVARARKNRETRFHIVRGRAGVADRDKRGESWQRRYLLSFSLPRGPRY